MLQIAAKTDGIDAFKHLHSLGFNGRQARKKSFISNKNKKRSMQWVREIKSETMAYWRKVVFTVDSKIKNSGSDGRVFDN